MAQPIYQHPVDPSTYDTNDPFGRVRPDTGRNHLGSDYKVGTGTPVHAISDGFIVASGSTPVLGGVVGVQCWDGVFHGFAHLSIDGPQVLGQAVSRGEVIGWSGNTGSASIGSHLHVSMGTTFGAIYGEGFGSTLVNPFERIQSLLATPAAAVPAVQPPPPIRSSDMPTMSQVVDGKMKGTGVYVLFGSTGKTETYNTKTQAQLINSIQRACQNQPIVEGTQAKLVAAEFAKVAPDLVLTEKQVSAIAAGMRPTPLTTAVIKAIGAEVIRQMKLAGN